MAAQLKVDIFNHHAICVIEVSNSEDQKEVVRVLNSWSRKRLKAEYSYKTNLVLLNVSDKEKSGEVNIDDWQSITAYLSETLKVSFHCSIGAIYSQPRDLHYSYNFV